ncbi:uncharacterized protein F5147DRAFT_777083 [Suillus discolor]|uniref:Uncharacterized protein n=1 Tax=Suillus discolor TaxID=1912936 RepID=A0A9P7JQX3_9AGAM|nr:uncharacterized protein F5147DRAFT_777083 [Suillus discolor]KAG2100176.1 hypothetical protein F5147DRAFT_777083 [Suillus discolor]
MTDNYQMLHKSAASRFSIWDAAEIFEYATSRFTAIHMTIMKDKNNHSNSYQHTFVRHIVWEAERFVFPFVNICAAMNINTTLPVYLNEVIFLITLFQTEPYDHGKLFTTFKACPHESGTHPIDINRVIPDYRHAWWKYRFDLAPFNMPLWMSVAQVKELVTSHFAQRPKMASMVPRPITNTRSDDPLLQQLQVLRAEVSHLGMELSQLLVAKLDAMSEAVAAFNRLEDPIDELREAMEASHAAVAMLQGHYETGRLGAPSSVEPFPRVQSLLC